MKCECGCGEEVKQGRRFIHNHHIRVNNPMKNPKIAKMISEGMKGNQNAKGTIRTEEFKNNISEKMKGNKHGEGTRGRIVSLETRNKISATKKGQIPWIAGKHHTEDSRKKMSLSHTGVKLSEEHKLKLGESRRGIKHTEETKMKMSVASKGKYIGPNASAWKGGISFEPYCHKFNENFKEKIRGKYDRICFLCGKSENDNIRKLSVHHVNYNKSCLCDDMVCEFVPLCIGCHSKTNHNRDYWEEVIMNKLELIT